MSCAAPVYAPEGVAVIGMAGRFPGASNLAQFWRNLVSGSESIVFFDDRELAAAGVSPELLKDPRYVKAAARLQDVEWFDAGFFGYSPKEAIAMDPQHRFFLECAWEALEEAGYAPGRHEGSVGVYAGSAINSYLCSYAQRLGSLEGDVLTMFLGNAVDFLSTRVSYKLNLRGPSLNVQTACSTSLVAVHLACQSLLHGECDMALAGGVSIKVTRTPGYFYQPGGIASPDGHCRAFDARAEGTLFGDGVGIVVLKRAADAMQDRDHIYGVIRGSAINNDGASKVGYTAPSVDGQAAVVAEAMAMAGVDPDTIGYIEAHGTGTALGDPVEIAALSQAFRAKTSQKEFCAIGSVKSNIGHLDAAAGIAGLIKTLMILNHGLLPPSLHFERPNPEIDFANSPFFVNTELREWKSVAHPGATPRRAGVSSFGMGGTNAHLIVEEPPGLPAVGKTIADASAHPVHLLTLSAKTQSALQALAARYGRYFDLHPDAALADVGFTSQVGRVHFPHRLAVIAASAEQARASLADFVAGRKAAGLFHGTFHETATQGHLPKPAFLAALAEGQDDWQQTLTTLGQLYVNGLEIDWNAIHRSHARNRVSLPTYPFERQRYWMQESLPVLPPAPEISHVRNEIEDAAPAARLDLTISYVRDQVLCVLGLDPSSHIDPRQGFFDMGMESLAALELKSRLESGLRCGLPSSFAMNYPTVEALAFFIAGQVLGLELSTPRAGVPAANRPEPDFAELDMVSEEDLAALLDSELERILGK